MYLLAIRFLIITSFLLPAFQAGSQAYQKDRDSLQRAYNNAQTPAEKLYLLNDLWEVWAYKDLHRALGYAREGLQISLQYKDKAMEGLFNHKLSSSFINGSQYDSAAYYAGRSVQIFRESGNETKERTAISNLALIHYYTGDFDAAHFLNQKNIQWYTEAENLSMLAYHQALEGTIYLNEGKLELALRNSFKALEIYRQLDKIRRAADVINSVAYCYFMQDRLGESLEFYRQARRIYVEIEDDHFLAQSSNDIGRVHLELQQLDSASFYIRQCLQQAIPFKLTALEATALANLGKIAEERGRYREAIQHFQEALQIFKTLHATPKIVEQHAHLAKTFLAWHLYPQALAHADTSLKLGLELGNLNAIQEAYGLQSQIYEQTAQYPESLFAMQQANLYQDSILDKEKVKILSEMEVLYDLGVQEERINTLEVENRLAETRATGLIAGVVLISLLAALTILFLIVRNRKNQMIRARESALERQRLQNANLEKQRLGELLDHRNRELTSQVLYVCQKNELLADVAAEIAEKSEHKVPLKGTLRKINRHLRGEEDWHQFMQAFVEVHPQFFKKLQNKYPRLTTKDHRLLALIRLNLSTKEIAGMLYLSPDSVKKAKHRLRKKMALDSSVDINDFLIKYSEN